MIEWRETYSVGIEKLDEQHRNLFQYSNDLESGIKNGAVSKQTLEGALKFLGSYVKGHFSQEEACMFKYACPMAKQNSMAHQKFIEAYKNFQDIIIKDDDHEGTLKQLHHFLETWLVDHICKIDVQLKPCVK